MNTFLAQQHPEELEQEDIYPDEDNIHNYIDPEWEDGEEEYRIADENSCFGIDGY